MLLENKLMKTHDKNNTVQNLFEDFRFMKKITLFFNTTLPLHFGHFDYSLIPKWNPSISGYFPPLVISTLECFFTVYSVCKKKSEKNLISLLPRPLIVIIASEIGKMMFYQHFLENK